MGFLNNIKKTFNFINNEKQSLNSDHINKKIKSFKYFDDLVHSGITEIVLDSDICLCDAEENIYKIGIKLDVDNIVIDGNGHTIDARGKTAIFLCFGENITIKNLKLKNGFSESDGGAINNQLDGNVEVFNCEFKDNAATHGAAILNFGKLLLQESKFFNNTTKNDGGAINNQLDGNVEVFNCEFNGNIAKSAGGAILNHGKVLLQKSKFINNNVKYAGGAINNQPDGDVEVFNCEFKDNTAKAAGAAILNFGKLVLQESKFFNNFSKQMGGAINNQPDGDVEVFNCEFKDNVAKAAGGAVMNNGKALLKESQFFNNYSSKYDDNIDGYGVGGAIYTGQGSVLSVVDCEFKENISNMGMCFYNESDDVTVSNCIFLQHKEFHNLIFNKSNLNIIGCFFKDNEGIDSIIFSEKESFLTVSGCKINNNQIKKSIIHTNAVECTVSNTIFENNVLDSDNDEGIDIFNEANLVIQATKFTNDNSVLNLGHIDVKKLSQSDVERIIKNDKNGSIDEFNIPKENKFDFSYLNNLIINSNDKIINLNEDVALENYELDFFEGGIEINEDDLIINGNGHIIDARNKTRIFNIIGKNIKLKNITFKNGLLINRFYEHTTGGGAIKIIKNSDLTLENCKFIDNSSNDDGGAILNNGLLNSTNNKYVNNTSEYNGGAIHNNNILCTVMDTYENNRSKIGGALYNNNKLILKKEIFLINNHSQFKEDIFNANFIKTENIRLNMQESIFNTHNIDINENIDEWESFNYLNSKLKDLKPLLDKNIKIEYDDIDNDIILFDDIEFDGNNHIIDFNEFNINFKIKNNVTIKNLTLKNVLIRKNSFFEIDGKIEFENVKFLNNYVTTNNYLINNNGELKFINSNFYNNKSKNTCLILNNKILLINETNFINNHANSNGVIIYNSNKNSINNSLFKYNSTNKYGGVLYNFHSSSVEINTSKFIKNSANIDGGAIINNGKILLNESQFISNVTKNNGGAIYNRSEVEISKCQFKENVAKVDGGAIMNLKKLSVDDSKFINNTAIKGGSINNSGGGSLNASNCEFKEIRSEAIYSPAVVTNSNIENCKFEDEDSN